MKIFVYDFDGTIYDGDSTVDFFFYCIRNYPRCILAVPYISLGFIKYKLRLCNKTQLKEHFFSFLKYVPDLDYAVEQFWRENRCKIKKFYQEKNHSFDVVISASPDFLLEPICKSMCVYYLIASRVNPMNGLFTGNNCYGMEKVQRLSEEFTEYEIEEFYSDSNADLPLAQLAKKAYLVEKNNCIIWDLNE